ISVLEPLIGHDGWAALSVLMIESLDQVEERLILVATDDAGPLLDEATGMRLLSLPGTASSLASGDGTPSALATLDALVLERQAAIQEEISQRNGHFLEAEAEKLDGWAEDQKLGLEREIKD